MSAITNNRIYLSSPHMGGNEQKYIQEAFDQNWVAPIGPNVDAFEKDIANYCGVRHVAALSSGTAAIHLALIMLGVQRDDEVISSSLTFSATVNPIAYLGATPVLIDSEPETWNMDPELLETAIIERQKLGKRIKAIIAVHIYGMPAKISGIKDISVKYGIPLVEDAAEALGSRYEGRLLGSFGDLGILSFNGNKIITTSGGGALLSDNPEFINKARFLSTQARDEAPHYQHSQIGYNYRMSNILAGIGRGQLEMIEDRVRKRRENFFFYKEHISAYEGITFLEEPDDRFFSNHWLTTILIDNEKTGTSREQIYTLLEANNIESRPIWKPMHLQPVFSSCPAFVNGVSENIFNNGLCLPSGSNLKEEERANVLEVIKALLYKKS